MKNIDIVERIREAMMLNYVLDCPRRRIKKSGCGRKPSNQTVQPVIRKAGEMRAVVAESYTEKPGGKLEKNTYSLKLQMNKN